jgi:carbon storage regulator
VGTPVLVLRRKAGEAIVIGDGVETAVIEISIIEISATRVKLGVTAPREVSVVRKETVAVAVDNRMAAELISSGADGCLDAIARALSGPAREFSAVHPKTLGGAADKKGEKDTPGIANTRENRGPA